jgi:hypothetical protein
MIDTISVEVRLLFLLFLESFYIIFPLHDESLSFLQN